MVMIVKDSNIMPNLESVSKTKIRGVLALLKHGELLTTQSEYGEPVRLSLASGIESFQSLRERHDSFLKSYMIDHHLFIPSPLRSELLWQGDEASRLFKLETMNSLVLKVKLFFRSKEEYRANALDSSELSGIENTMLNSSTSAAATSNMGDGNGSYKHISPSSNGGGTQQQQTQQQGYGYTAGRTGSGGRLGGSSGQIRGGVAGAGGRAGHSPYSNPGRYGAPPYPYSTGAASGGVSGYGAGGYPPNTRPGSGGYGNNYHTRAQQQQQQRYSNAQASYPGSNEDYAEMMKDDWSAAKTSTTTAASAGGGSNNGRTQRSIPSSARPYLSSQALSFEPSAAGNPYHTSRPAPEQQHYGLMTDSLNVSEDFFQNNSVQNDHHRSSSSAGSNPDPKIAAKRQTMFSSLSKLAEETAGPAPGSFDPMSWLSQTAPPPSTAPSMANSRVMPWENATSQNNSVSLESASFFSPAPSNMASSLEDSEPIDFGALNMHVPPFPPSDTHHSTQLSAYGSSGSNADSLDLSLSFDNHTAVAKDASAIQYSLPSADPFPVPAGAVVSSAATADASVPLDVSTVSTDTAMVAAVAVVSESPIATTDTAATETVLSTATLHSSTNTDQENSNTA